MSSTSPTWTRILSMYIIKNIQKYWNDSKYFWIVVATYPFFPFSETVLEKFWINSSWNSVPLKRLDKNQDVSKQFITMVCTTDLCWHHKNLHLPAQRSVFLKSLVLASKCFVLNVLCRMTWFVLVWFRYISSKLLLFFCRAVRRFKIFNIYIWHSFCWVSWSHI